MKEAPVRMCCFERHYGPQCPDGLVMCCICFTRFEVADLAVEDGHPIDVCKKCHSVVQSLAKSILPKEVKNDR